MISLKKLKKLSLRNFPVTDMPAILLNFTSDFAKMDIKTLPESIPKMENIERLDFEGNKIAVVPASIAQITNLKYLYLDKNELTEICDAIFELSYLV